MSLLRAMNGNYVQGELKSLRWALLGVRTLKWRTIFRAVLLTTWMTVRSPLLEVSYRAFLVLGTCVLAVIGPVANGTVLACFLDRVARLLLLN